MVHAGLIAEPFDTFVRCIRVFSNTLRYIPRISTVFSKIPVSIAKVIRRYHGGVPKQLGGADFWTNSEHPRGGVAGICVKLLYMASPTFGHGFPKLDVTMWAPSPNPSAFLCDYAHFFEDVAIYPEKLDSLLEDTRKCREGDP